MMKIKEAAKSAATNFYNDFALFAKCAALRKQGCR
jgi:hypothetical protein